MARRGRVINMCQAGSDSLEVGVYLHASDGEGKVHETWEPTESMEAFPAKWFAGIVYVAN